MAIAQVSFSYFYCVETSHSFKQTLKKQVVFLDNTGNSAIGFLPTTYQSTTNERMGAKNKSATVNK